MPPPSWLIRDWLPANSLILFYGEPGSGKTFAALDMASSIAIGQDWNGRKVKRGVVIYIAGEGVAGLGKRIRAIAAQNPNIYNAPIFTIPSAVDLVDQGDEIILRASELAGIHGDVVLVIVDTLSRTLGAGREENSNRDMRDYVRAADRIREALGCAVVIVHHSGKDAGRGPRGHSSLIGDIDVSIEVTGSGSVHTLVCKKQKDEGKPEPLVFRLDVVSIGRGTDGETESSCTVNFTGTTTAITKREYPKGVRQELIARLAASMLTEPGAAKCPLDQSRPALAVDALLLGWKATVVGKSAPSYFRDTLRVMVDRGLLVSDGVLVWLP